MKGNPWIQKIAGLAAAYIVSFAAAHSLTLSTDEVTAIMLTTLTAIEFIVSKHTNPGNASSSHLAAKESVEVAQLKANDL